MPAHHRHRFARALKKALGVKPAEVIPSPDVLAAT
jgi:hypothetical protein